MKRCSFLIVAFLLAVTPAMADQLILNPSFEDPATGAGQPTAWSGMAGERIVDADLFGGIDPPPASYPDGNQVVRAFATSWGTMPSPRGWYQQVPVVNGGTYTIAGYLWTSGWRYTAPAQEYPNNQQGRIGVDTGGASTSVAAVDVWCASPGETAPSDGWYSSQQEWVHLSTTFTAQASTVTVYIDSRNISAIEWSGVHFDLVTLDGPNPLAPTPTPSPTITPLPLASFNGDFEQGSQSLGGELAYANKWRLWYVNDGIYGIPLTGIDPFPGTGSNSQSFRMIDFGVRGGKQMDSGLAAYVSVTPGQEYEILATFVKDATGPDLDSTSVTFNLGYSLTGAIPALGGISDPTATFPNVTWISEPPDHTPGLTSTAEGASTPSEQAVTLSTGPFTATGSALSILVEVQTNTTLETRLGYVDNVLIIVPASDVERRSWNQYR